jgi:hypothetical protein
MKRIRRIIYFLFLGLTTVSIAQETMTAPKYSNEFLQIGVGADALGRANAMVAGVEGVNGLYWNPAALTKTAKWLEVAGMHSEYFAGIAKYDYIGIAHALNERSAIGVSMIRFAVDDIPNTTQLIDKEGNVDYNRITLFSAADYAFSFSYAQKMKIEGLSLGGSFKVIHRKVGDLAKSWGFGLDAGLQYESKKYWKFGLMARDVSSTFNAWIFNLDQATKEIFAQTGNAIPQNGMEITLPRFILGTQGKFPIGAKGDYVAGELDVDITTDGKRNVLIAAKPFSIDPHLGVEVGIRKYVAVRFGIGNMQYIKDFDDSKKLTFQPNIGLGLMLTNFKLDYAFTDIGDMSTALYSHVFSVKIGLNKPEGVVK